MEKLFEAGTLRKGWVYKRECGHLCHWQRCWRKRGVQKGMRRGRGEVVCPSLIKERLLAGQVSGVCDKSCSWVIIPQQGQGRSLFFGEGGLLPGNMKPLYRQHV